MGRLHSNGKGISSSAIPYSRTAPPWLKTTPEQVVEQICKLARLAPEIPDNKEDLYMLIKKAVAVRKHLQVNRKDKDSKLYGFLEFRQNLLY
ncbi:ribosomal 40S subunit protein S13 [Kalmusia sp. IMI 367209]|nr:ribosomal 40S subunit protein S13 [Kalmusia sp. IMI 367209]